MPLLLNDIALFVVILYKDPRYSKGFPVLISL